MTYVSAKLVPSVHVPDRRLRTWPRKQQRRYRRLYDRITFGSIYQNVVAMLDGELLPDISSVVWKPTRLDGDTLHCEMTITKMIVTEPYRGQSDVEIEVDFCAMPSPSARTVEVKVDGTLWEYREATAIEALDAESAGAYVLAGDEDTFWVPVRMIGEVKL